MIWSDANTDGVIDDGELNPFGIYAGDLHVFDADGDGFGDLATIGFGAGTRRAADGSTLAIPETSLFLFHTMLEDGTPILRDAGLDLYGLANGTISSGDVDGDGASLLLNGEDFFALPGNENNLADSSRAGGNPVTLIYRNLLADNRARYGDARLAFENALFVPNLYDQRWASFDYAVDAAELAELPEVTSTTLAGLYELELHATDHRRAGVEEIQAYTEPDRTPHLGSVDVNGSAYSLAQFKAELARNAACDAALFVEPEYTDRNEAASSPPMPPVWMPRADGNWTWTWRQQIHHFHGDLSDLVDYWRAEHQGESLLAAIEGFTASKDGRRSKPMTCSRCEGTAVQDEFRIGDSRQNLYGIPVNQEAEGSIVVIKDFNPFLDTVELYLPEDASFVWDQILYRKDPQADPAGFADRVLATDEGGNERAAERFLSQPILDSYGREVVHSYVLQEYRPNDYTQASVDLGLRGAVLRINSIIDGVRAPETLIFFDGIDQDLLHFQTSFNEGHLRFASADDDARRQLRFIVSNNGTDSDDNLDEADAYRIPFRRSLLGDWLDDAFTGLPEFFGVLTGGDGDDVLQGSRAEGAVPVVYLDGGLGDDTLFGSDVDGYADVLLGQEGHDRLVGLRGPNRMEGGSGSDTLIGGFNNDTLLGGAGEDLLVGGEGFDMVSHADDPSGVQVNLGWRQQPVLVLPGSGEALRLSPNTLLADLPAELLALLSAMASRGFRRFDPSSSLANLLNELSVGEQALLPELADITAGNPVIWIPSDPNGTLVRLSRNALLRDVDSDVRTSIESALLRQGSVPLHPQRGGSQSPGHVQPTG